MEVKNHILHGYRQKPICDVHVHTSEQRPIGESLEVFKSIMEHFNHAKMLINAIPSKYGVAENEKALYMKAKIKGVYANAGPMHRYDERDTAEGYLEQIKNYHAMGFDGIKILDGKPDRRLKLGRPLSDSVFDKFYSYAEENGIPVLMHVGDPPQWWHEETCPEAAKALGWYYAEPRYTPFEETVHEVAEILTKFPHLKLTLAIFSYLN